MTKRPFVRLGDEGSKGTAWAIGKDVGAPSGARYRDASGHDVRDGTDGRRA
jgi:hypothetical protein